MTQSEQTQVTQDKPKTAPTIDDLINSTNIKPDDVSIDSSSDDDYKSAEPINHEKEPEHGEEKRERNEKEKEEVKPSSAKTAAADLDEYGNEVPKARVYTEEEVNRMMRERFSRGSFANQPQTPAQQQATPQEVKDAAQDFKPDPNSTDSWDVQLNKFIDHRLEQKFESLYERKERRAREEEWKQKENIKQQEFQHKFSTGIEKYKDFREVAGQMPITDSMMIATREFKDPAAFVYAASKHHPDELKRIAALPDPYQQAVEVGRLEERMRKNRAVTKAAPPLRQTSSDVTGKVEPKPNIDHAITQHAKRKLRR